MPGRQLIIRHLRPLLDGPAIHRTWRQFVLAADVQIRVVRALLLREVRSRFSGDSLGIFWAVIEPVAMMLVFYAIWSIRGRQVEGMPLHLFLITGFLPFFMFQHALTGAQQALKAGRPLLAFPRVKPLDLIVARAVFDFCVLTLVLACLVLLIHFVDGPVRIREPFLVMAMIVLMAAMGFGLGCSLAAIGSYYPVVNRIVPIAIGRPLFFTSGLFFTADMMPESVRGIMLFNPLMHAIELIRTHFFVTFQSTGAYFLYPFAFGLVMLAIGLMFLSAMRRHLYVERVI